MKVPTEVAAKIAELGKRVLDDDETEVDIGEQGAIWLRNQQPVFALGVLADWFRKQTRQWIYKQTRDALRDDQEGGAEPLQLAFPELRPYLEVAPGIQKHQAVMNGDDWDHTLAIWRNRRDQAEISYREVERAYNVVRPLLVGDMTTGDVVDRLRPYRAVG